MPNSLLTVFHVRDEGEEIDLVFDKLENVVDYVADAICLGIGSLGDSVKFRISQGEMTWAQYHQMDRLENL